MAQHDLYHLRPVRRTTGRRLDHHGRFAEILRAECGGCNHTQCLHVFAAVVVELVSGAPRNAQRLPRPHVDQLTDRSRQHAVDAVDRFLVVVVAVRWRRAAGTTTSRTATVPDEFSPVMRNRTSIGPRLIVSPAGLTHGLIDCSDMEASFLQIVSWIVMEPVMPGEEAPIRTWDQPRAPGRSTLFWQGAASRNDP